MSESDCEEMKTREASLTDESVPQSLACAIARLPIMNAALDIIRIAGVDGQALPEVARVYFSIGERFGFDWLRQAAGNMEAQSSWQRQALRAMIDELYALQQELVTHVVEAAGGTAAAEGVIQAWTSARKSDVERTERQLGEMRASGSPDIAMLAVAIRQLRVLVSGQGRR